MSVVLKADCPPEVLTPQSVAILGTWRACALKIVNTPVPALYLLSTPCHSVNIFHFTWFLHTLVTASDCTINCQIYSDRLLLMGIFYYHWHK